MDSVLLAMAKEFRRQYHVAREARLKRDHEAKLKLAVGMRQILEWCMKTEAEKRRRQAILKSEGGGVCLSQVSSSDKEPYAARPPVPANVVLADSMEVHPPPPKTNKTEIVSLCFGVRCAVSRCVAHCVASLLCVNRFPERRLASTTASCILSSQGTAVSNPLFHFQIWTSSSWLSLSAALGGGAGTAGGDSRRVAGEGGNGAASAVVRG